MSDLWDVADVRAHLVGAAEAGHPVTYSEILNNLGYAFSRPKMRALCATLGDVDAQARGRGEPELAVLVVRASDGLPGQGWWVSSDLRGYQGPWEGPRAQDFVAGLQQEVFDYWSGDR